MNRHNASRGFTLIELMLVLVILGILASVVVAKFSISMEDARSSTVRSMLLTIRGQLELYRLEHGDRYPDPARMWDALTQRTDAAGKVDPAGPRGPYIRTPPVNLYTHSTRVAAPGAGTILDGWEYDPDSGRITAVGFDEETGAYVPPTP